MIPGRQGPAPVFPGAGETGTGGATADDLRRALDIRGAAGLPRLDFWWRDDDLQRPGAALDPLLAMEGETGWAPGLAVIPRGMDAGGLARRLEASAAEILVHGHAHHDHAGPGAKKCEFPASRPLAEMEAELRAGAGRLRAAFPDRFRACFVPPWNRITPDLVPVLPECGYAVLSAWGPRGAARQVPGLCHVNTHIDVMDWRGSRRFIGAGAVRAAICARLAAPAAGDAAEYGEPCGLLTHHLVMMEEDWHALAGIARELAAHGAVRLCAPGACFHPGAGTGEME